MDESTSPPTTEASSPFTGSSLHKNKKLIAFLLAPSVLIIILGVVLIYTASNKTSLTSLPSTTTKPNVVVKTEYENPFDKSAQYVNPFSSYKNPFDTLK